MAVGQSSCSLTCGDAFHTRSRSCTNPKPSITGQYCVGESVDVELCRNAVCKAPKNGTYQFSVTLAVKPYRNCTVSVVKNQIINAIGYLFNDIESNWHHSSSSTVALLSTGDRIWVSYMIHCDIFGIGEFGYAFIFNSMFSGFYIGGF